MTASMKDLLQWDDKDPLGPMELTGAYYVRGHREGLAEGRARGLAEGRARVVEEGRARGVEEGRARGIEQGIEGVCEVLDIALGPSERAQMQALDTAGLDALFAELKLHRRWPTPSP
jgi:hypothetical protein